METSNFKFPEWDLLPENQPVDKRKRAPAPVKEIPSKEETTADTDTDEPDSEEEDDFEEDSDEG